MTEIQIHDVSISNWKKTDTSQTNVALHVLLEVLEIKTVSLHCYTKRNDNKKTLV